MRYIAVSALLLLLAPAAAQQGVPLSIEYYQQRILETDARAAALAYENAQLKARVNDLMNKLADKPESKKK